MALPFLLALIIPLRDCKDFKFPPKQPHVVSKWPRQA
jgi:hypothetical protein